MTEAVRAKKPRLSRGMLRAWAWVVGGAAFFAPFVVLAGAPKPAVAVDAERATKAPRKVIIRRKIIRRVIVVEQPKTQPVQYVYTSGGSSGSGSSSSGGSAPPPSSTGGS